MNTLPDVPAKHSGTACEFRIFIRTLGRWSEWTSLLDPRISPSTETELRALARSSGMKIEFR